MPNYIFRNRDGMSLPLENDGPPDTFTPSGLCPRCQKQSSFEILSSTPVTFDGSKSPMGNGRSYIDQVSILQCRHCNQCVVVIEEKWLGDQPLRKQKGISSVPKPLTFRGFHWWPVTQAVISDDVPSEIAEAFSEAIICLHATAPRAAVVMARRTLEAITADKGETNGTLASRLDALATRNVLLPDLADWAKEVRLIGNIGAHYDPMEKATMEDARDLVNFVQELMGYLYELPAELARRRNKT